MKALYVFFILESDPEIIWTLQIVRLSPINLVFVLDTKKDMIYLLDTVFWGIHWLSNVYCRINVIHLLKELLRSELYF